MEEQLRVVAKSMATTGVDQKKDVHSRLVEVFLFYSKLLYEPTGDLMSIGKFIIMCK